MTDSAHSDQTELERLLRKGRPWLEENATTLIYLLAAVLAVAAVFVYVNRTPSGNAEASYELMIANSPEEYGDVADAFPTTLIGTWARLREADRLLDDGISHLFTDRPTGEEELADAEKAYNRLAERTDIDDELRERIMVGLARLAETRNDGSPEKVNAAVEAWQTLLTAFPDSLLKEHAEQRIKRLQTEDSKAFYAWFSKQNPTPAAPATGLDPATPEVPQVPDLDELLKGATTPATELPVGTESESAGSEEAVPAEAESQTPPADESENNDGASDADGAAAAPATEPPTADAAPAPAADESSTDGDDAEASSESADGADAESAAETSEPGADAEESSEAGN